MVLSNDIQEKLKAHRDEKAQQSNQNNSESGKKFSTEELEKISSIKNAYDAITLRMGQVHFELGSLTDEKAELENQFSKNREEEIGFAKQLTEKYGKGSLDISTGIFTPTE